MAAASHHSAHIPELRSIAEFYERLGIGTPQTKDFAAMRIEDQPPTKNLEMPLFRCRFYRIVFFRNAGVSFRSMGESFDSYPNSLYFSHPGKLESWLTQGKIQGVLVCFTPEFIEDQMGHLSLDQQFPYFQPQESGILSLPPASVAMLQPVQLALLREISDRVGDHAEMIRHLLFQYMILIRRIFQEQEAARPPEQHNQIRIYNRFRRAVDAYMADLAQGKVQLAPSVRIIADLLALHPSYLNTVIKSVSGQTASSIIHGKILLEAKSYLLHTGLQISEVAYQLGFKDVSYFNRFFKRLADQTPLSFRKSNNL